MNPDEPTPCGPVTKRSTPRAVCPAARSVAGRKLITCLRQARKSRQPRARGEDGRRGKLPNLVSIHDRHAEIDERIVPGHWEGDLIKGTRNASSVATLVELTALFVTPGKMENATADAAVTSVQYEPEPHRYAQRQLSLTYDQGGKWRNTSRSPKRRASRSTLPIQSPWQRGRNENTNGLLRQYMPKGTDLAVFSQVELDDIAWKMNTRPRQ
ncbi:MAG: IS30 family transposase [Burkholderia sp.]